ncbi:unnamed protein product, partial [marine sediment metagenome]
GGTLCAGCIGKDRETLAVSPGTRALIIHMQRKNFPALSRLRIAPAMHKELEAILRGFVGFHIEVRPNALEFLRKLRNYEETG